MNNCMFATAYNGHRSCGSHLNCCPPIACHSSSRPSGSAIPAFHTSRMLIDLLLLGQLVCPADAVDYNPAPEIKYADSSEFFNVLLLLNDDRWLKVVFRFWWPEIHGSTGLPNNLICIYPVCTLYADDSAERVGMMLYFQQTDGQLLLHVLSHTLPFTFIFF